jgi:hypothetical protein
MKKLRDVYKTPCIKYKIEIFKSLFINKPEGFL